MAEELKPCPFCEGKAKLCKTLRQNTSCGKTYYYTVKCTQCHAVIFIYESLSGAVEAWNNRV